MMIQCYYTIIEDEKKTDIIETEQKRMIREQIKRLIYERNILVIFLRQSI